MENSPVSDFSKEAEKKPSESKEKDFAGGQSDDFLMPYLAELIHFIKNNLASVKSTAFLALDKPDSLEFKKCIAEDIGKIESVLNTLLNYININTPIVKSNTFHTIFEEIFAANEKQVRNKRVRIIKKYEKNLPETYVHDEQLRFILNSILQHAILSAPTDGTIEVLIKSFDFQSARDKMASLKRGEGFVEFIVAFPGVSKASKFPDGLTQRRGPEKESTNHLVLLLAKDILQRNRGTMTIEVDEGKPRTLITLRFPIERRKVIHYEPVSL